MNLALPAPLKILENQCGQKTFHLDQKKNVKSKKSDIWKKLFTTTRNRLFPN